MSTIQRFHDKRAAAPPPGPAVPDYSRWAVSSDYNRLIDPPFTRDPVLDGYEVEPVPTHYVSFDAGAASGDGSLATPWNATNLASQYNTAGSVLNNYVTNTGDAVIEIVTAGIARINITPAWNHATRTVTLRAKSTLPEDSCKIAASDDLLGGFVTHRTAGETGGIQMYKRTLSSPPSFSDSTPPDSSRHSARSRYSLWVDNIQYREVYDSTDSAANLAALEGKTSGGWFVYNRADNTYYVKPYNGNYHRRVLNVGGSDTTDSSLDIRPNHTTNFTSRLVEHNKRETILGSEDSDAGIRRGFTFRRIWFHGGGHRWQSASVNLGTDCQLLYCKVSGAHSTGVRGGGNRANSGNNNSSNILVKGCRITDNGQNGIVCYRVWGTSKSPWDRDDAFRGMLIRDTLMEYNNFEGFDSGNEAGGSKLVRSQSKFINCIARHNYGYGLWKDIDNFGGATIDCRTHDNHRAGYSNEISGADILRNHVAEFNGFATSTTEGGPAILTYCSPVHYEGFIVLNKNKVNEVLRDDSRATARLTAQSSTRQGVISIADNESTAECLLKLNERPFDAVTAPLYTASGNIYFERPSGNEYQRSNSSTGKNVFTNLADFVADNNNDPTTSERQPVYETGSVAYPNTDTTILPGIRSAFALRENRQLLPTQLDVRPYWMP